MSAFSFYFTDCSSVFCVAAIYAYLFALVSIGNSSSVAQRVGLRSPFDAVVASSPGIVEAGGAWAGNANTSFTGICNFTTVQRITEVNEISLSLSRSLLKDTVDGLNRTQQRGIEGQLYNKVNELQEELSLKKFDLRAKQLHFAAIKAQVSENLLIQLKILLKKESSFNEILHKNLNVCWQL